MIDCIKTYVSMGYPVFPCSSRTKAPITPHGFKNASLDLNKVDEWFRLYPDCAWGVVTSSERGVIDIDPRNGGSESLAKLIAEHGPMPLTPTVRTGGGGWHYWLRFPEGTKCGKPFPGIDRKAEGGYVIVPPSRIDCPEHEGRSYLWEVRPWETPLADAPGWLLSFLPDAKAKAVAEADPWIVQPACLDLLSHPGSPEGERRKTLCQLVGVHLARGDSEASIKAMAEAWADRCTPPLTEWRKHVDGLLRREAGRMTTSSLPLPDGAVLLSPEAGKEGKKIPEPEADFLPSFPAVGTGEGEAKGKHQTSFLPSLPPEAYHGLMGEMLKAISPETEADPAGVLLGWLTCFGSVVGRGAWVTVGPRLHHPALYVGIVGRTSDAKGDGWASALYPFRQVESAWASACIANGVGSGEGLIERVADEQRLIDKEGKARVIPGATDKRCLLRLSELSRCFKVGRRENATVSEYLREAWDGEPIHLPNRKGNALSTSGYAIGLIGDITPGVVRKLMEGGMEAFDGWANRFLWGAVKRSRFLPSGGKIDVVNQYLPALADALTFAKTAGEVRRDAEADALWDAVYPSLTTSGDTVPHTDRARPYAMRLAMLYALADRSQTIRLDHLRAALAVWEYCRASARLIFGGQAEQAEPDPLWLRVLNDIGSSPGVSRSDLLRAFRSSSADELDVILGKLEAQRLAHRRMVETGGRAAECWWQGTGGDEDDNNHASPPDLLPGDGKEGKKPPADAPCPDAGKDGKEGKKPPATADGEDTSFLPASGDGEGVGGDTSFLPTPGDGTEPRGVLDVVSQKASAKYPDAESVRRAIDGIPGATVVKDEEGRCWLTLPQPNPELEEAFALLYGEICEREMLTDAGFMNPLDELMRVQTSSLGTE